MTSKNSVWAVGTACVMALTQSCATFHQPQLDDALLHSKKGKPSESTPIAFTPSAIFQVSYDYTDNDKNIRTVLFIVNRNDDPFLKPEEIEGAAHMVSNPKTGQKSAIGITTESVTYTEYLHGKPTTIPHVISDATFAKEELERVKALILNIAPVGRQIVQATPNTLE